MTFPSVTPEPAPAGCLWAVLLAVVGWAVVVTIVAVAWRMAS